MKRKDFLKKLGFGVGAAVVAPIVSFKDEESIVKVTDITPDEVPVKGVYDKPPLAPCLGDHCVDPKGRKWYIKNRENRHGYGWPDRTILVLAPRFNPKYITVDKLTNKKLPKRIPIRRRISIHDFNRYYTITKRRDEFRD